MLTGLFSYEVKYKIYFYLRQTWRWTFNTMAMMHFDLLSVQLTYHVYVKRKHATPGNIHTEVAWSSLNN